MSIYPTNDAMFDEARALNLPLGRYAITSSGPLGIRDIRKIGDIDMIVDDDLWVLLSARFGEIEENGLKKIRIGDNIEILGVGSLANPLEGAPTVAEQIASAEVLFELSFVSLEHVLWFKEHMGRDKDKPDIEILKKLLGKV